MTANATSEIQADIENLGTDFQPFPVHRNSLNILQDIATLRNLRKTYRRLKPDLILSYTIKPIIWGGIAARSCPQTKFFALVTGLGYAFQGTTLKRRLLNSLVTKLYRFALGRSSGVIFQNSDNRNLFVQRKIVPAEKCHVVKGSGINVLDFAHTPLPDGPARFLLIARLLGEKGIREYAAAAKIVKSRYPDSVFELVGPEDPSPDGISIKEIESFTDDETLAYSGSTIDVRPFIKACHVYVLPSYHEGMPRTVLEAMAIGRPILTTDVPGCRDTVKPDANGWLVPKANAEALANKMIEAIEHRGRWQTMGNESRRIAEEEFDVHKVNASMLEIMGIEQKKGTHS